LTFSATASFCPDSHFTSPPTSRHATTCWGTSSPTGWPDASTCSRPRGPIRTCGRDSSTTSPTSWTCSCETGRAGRCSSAGFPLDSPIGRSRQESRATLRILMSAAKAAGAP